MADVLNRSTFLLLRSVNTADYSPVDWVINPDLTAVVGWPSRYWTLVADAVGLMTPAERAAVDGAELAAARDAVASSLTDVENIDRALLRILMDELNSHTARINAILTAIDNASSLANLRSAVVGIADLPVRTDADLRVGLRAKLGT
jgi:hypothetical protein